MTAFQKAVKNNKKLVDNETKILSIARETIQIESEILLALKDSLGAEFCATVLAVFQSKGRLVITGIGKSAIVAQKIVATLNSTGTSSLFMHAADAIHGDLGMIGSDDIVLCLSKSGETPEIKVLVPLVRQQGNTLIAMSSQRDSYLAKQAHFLLYLPVSQEADSNNLIPTASTTAQIAMGDALAMSLLVLRGFTSRDFAQFHPGGTIGKQLYLQVRDIYPHNERPSVSPEESIRAAIMEMTSKRLGVTVVEEAGKVCGIITDGDLRRMLEKDTNLNNLKAKDIMNTAPKTIQEEALAVNALELLRSHSITQLLVLRGEEYVGILHLHDLIREGIV